jgi:tRNA(Ile)-lysidine synthase
VTELASRLRDRLDRLEARLGQPRNTIIAFSGGLDSTALLHALVEAGRTPGLVAVHVDHQLHPDSATWALRAVDEARLLGVDCVIETVTTAVTAGEGVEAAARAARYAALQKRLEPGDWLLTAHHLDDQVETLLLNMLRGSGPDGLAAMPDVRELAAGWLVRPLLEVSRGELAEYASLHKLAWLDDPANAVLDFDRNFLRQEVLPRLEGRWPDAARRLARTVERQQEVSRLLGEIGADDLERIGAEGRLDVAQLLAMSPARRRNVLRTAIRDAGLTMPPRTALLAIDGELLPARGDASPLVQWRGGEARRYRGNVYLGKPLGKPPEQALDFDGHSAGLPDGLGTLVLEERGEPGLGRDIVGRGLSVRWRQGGETLRVTPDGPTRALRKLLQEAGVVPWMRDRLPLIYAGEELVAVADRFVAAGATGSPGFAVRWIDAPQIT